MRLSTIFLLIALSGFFILIAFSLYLQTLTITKQNWIFYFSITIIIILLFPIGLIGMKVFSKRECKKGLHEPDKWGICSYCKKELPITDKQMDKNIKEQEKAEKQLETKKGMIKFLLPTLVFIIISLGFLIFIINSTNHDISEAINSLNATQKNVCLGLIKYKSMNDQMPFFFDQIKNTVKQKYNQLDCPNQSIIDDKNNTCPIGYPPVITNTGFMQAEFLCKKPIGDTHK